MVSASGLVALIWASAALATPLKANRISSSELEVRHSDLEIRQSTRKCPSSYTSKNGLKFKTYCNQNNPWNDAWPSFITNTMEECFETCSRFWGKSEGCYGIVWGSDNKCWIRNSTMSESTLKTSSIGDHTAMVDRTQLTALDTTCPGEDREIKTYENGVKYTVNCNKDIPGAYDTCWQGYPLCDSNPFQAFWHATSLEECLGFCLKEHPLCLGAIYNPGMELGYANCWPKTGFPQGALPQTESGKGIIHSATITQFDLIDKICPKETLYTSKSNKAFQIHCGQLNTGSNITSIHTQNVTSCVDACATSDKGCVGILFDSSMQGGFSNCYLQNSSLVITDQATATYAALTNSPASSGSGAPTTSGSSSNNNNNGNSNSESGSSKAWIAGPVIGGIVALALIGGGIFWWRRRKAQPPMAEMPTGDATIAEKDGSYPPAYAQLGHAGGYQQPAVEMGSNEPYGNEMATKYAQSHTATPGVRHELQ